MNSLLKLILLSLICILTTTITTSSPLPSPPSQPNSEPQTTTTSLNISDVSSGGGETVSQQHSEGYTGTIFLGYNKLSELFGEIKNLVKGLETTCDSANVDANPIAAQERWLAQEVRQLANSMQITVLNGSCGQTNVLFLILLAATLGALGYVYIWWKGFCISNLMYVTKRNMAAEVASVTENLRSVNEAFEVRCEIFQNLDEKIEEQKELSKLIMSEVRDVDGELVKIDYDLNCIGEKIEKLKNSMTEIDKDQELTLMVVRYLTEIAEQPH